MKAQPCQVSGNQRENVELLHWLHLARVTRCACLTLLARSDLAPMSVRSDQVSEASLSV